MSEPIIDIENAVVSYREDVVLHGVSLRVTSGEFVGIIGPNGAGKTTLLTIVNGLGNLVSGSVQVFGQPILHNNRHELRRLVGYVAQVENIDANVCARSGHDRALRTIRIIAPTRKRGLGNC